VTALEANLYSVRERIAASARRSGRCDSAVQLIAVTKLQPVETVFAAYELGLRHFGENRVEELGPKASALPHDTCWHMIGHVQGRKARQAVELCHVVQSVDSLKLAQRLDQICTEHVRKLNVLIELNVAGESSKYGLDASQMLQDKERHAELVAVIRQIISLPHLEVLGLMTMAPLVQHQELARPVFNTLRRIRDQLAAQLPHTPLHQLSMGMSDDFEVAIEEGATMVRLGRALFSPDLASSRKL